MSKDGATLFIDKRKLDEKGKKILEENGVNLMPYQDVYGVVEQISGKVLIDKEKTNYALFSRIADAKKPTFFPRPFAKLSKTPSR